MRKQAEERVWGTLATVAAAVSLALTLACSDQPGDQSRRNAADRQKQNTQADGETTLATRVVTGTVKQVVDDGIVVYGHEEGESDREWAFVIESGTRIDKAGQVMGVNSLREGDPVKVMCTNRDGKIIARSVTTPSEIPASGSR